ncbi:MAG: hypothetical protein A3H93_18115 [Rhodocyclales bacterium RIFCSPLOWO2_02_FULL_63_24]|nr:MAG: hypothetical protein A3H93_18115 [Rhodocyclales bacterium RIFCSPLOWO2_02_FULL_63_24]
MIILSDYLMGRDALYPAALTEAITENAKDLLGRVNLLLSWAYKENVRPALDKITGTHVASGWRPPMVNDATSNAAAHSSHLDGNGIDLRDNGLRDLARWCLRNLDALDEIGLYMEDPQWTPTWVHLQRVPPKSRRRVYIPSSKPPLVAMLPEQEQGLGNVA